MICVVCGRCFFPFLSNEACCSISCLLNLKKSKKESGFE